MSGSSSSPSRFTESEKRFIRSPSSSNDQMRRYYKRRLPAKVKIIAEDLAVLIKYGWDLTEVFEVLDGVTDEMVKEKIAGLRGTIEVLENISKGMDVGDKVSVKKDVTGDTDKKKEEKEQEWDI